MLKFLKKILAFFLILLFASCVSYKPIFEENQKFITVGKEIANNDFNKCRKKADDYLDEYKSKRIANEVFRKATFGAIFGGITGFIFGNSTQSLLRGAVGGGIVGGVYGGLVSAGAGNLTSDEIKQRYITKCLNQNGYEIIGWY